MKSTGIIHPRKLLPLLALGLIGQVSGASVFDVLPQIEVAVANGRTITFFDSAGVQQAALTVPYPGGTTESIRDITRLSNGRLAVFNGTFNPQLSIYDITTDAWTHAQIAGWSTFNNNRFGGLAAFGNYLFASDANTSGAEAAGSIRYNVLDGTWSRYDTVHGTHDVNVGLNGLVYSLGQGGDPANLVRVYDPTSLQLLQSVTFQRSSIPSWQPNSVAADAAGLIYVGNNALGAIHVFDSNGVLQRTIATGKSAVMDLDLREDGTLVFGTFSEGMFMSNPEQTVFTRVGTVSAGYGTFMIPEAGTTVYLGLAVALLCRRQRRSAHC